MVKIAIIDSGIKRKSFIDTEFVKQGFGIDIVNGSIQVNTDYEDANGHGYFCAQTILSQCTNAELYIIRILNKNNVGNSKCLETALKLILELKPDIVNLSLAMCGFKKNENIKKLCKIISQKGILIIVSLENRKENSFPADIEDVIGVKGISEIGPFNYTYCPQKRIQCEAANTPVLVKNIQDGYTFFGGNSKAAALVTGILADKINRTENNDKQNILTKYSSDNNSKKSLSTSFKTKEEYSEEKINSLVNFISIIWNLDEERKELLYKEPLYSSKIIANKELFGYLIQKLELEKDFKFNTIETLFNIFDSVYSLYDAIDEAIKNGKNIT